MDFIEQKTIGRDMSALRLTDIKFRKFDCLVRFGESTTANGHPIPTTNFTPDIAPGNPQFATHLPQLEPVSEQLGFGKTVGQLPIMYCKSCQ